MEQLKDGPQFRTREAVTGNEEAGAELKLGEFDGVHSLSVSEARVLIKAVLDHRTEERRQNGETE